MVVPVRRANFPAAEQSLISESLHFPVSSADLTAPIRPITKGFLSSVSVCHI